MNTPRANRATELARYFARQGHETILYGVLGNYDYSIDESMCGIKVKNLGPMLFSTFTCDPNCRRTKVWQKVLSILLGRFLEFPDIELSFRTRNTIKRENAVDLLITVATPYPIHWGAAWAKKNMQKEFPKVWVSDCGDPYMGNSVHKKHPFYFQYIENFWGKQTDYIAIPIEKGRIGYSDLVQEKIRVIPQGFNMSNTGFVSAYQKNAIPTFAYAGMCYRDYRDPTQFLRYLSGLRGDFVFHVYTRAKAFFVPYQEVLGRRLVLHDYVPRQKLLSELSQMDFLINLKNNSEVQAPSKLIDYAVTGRPILDVSSSFTEMNSFVEFCAETYTHQHPPIDLSLFDIENVGKKFLDIVNT